MYILQSVCQHSFGGNFSYILTFHGVNSIQSKAVAKSEHIYTLLCDCASLLALLCSRLTKKKKKSKREPKLNKYFPKSLLRIKK